MTKSLVYTGLKKALHDLLIVVTFSSYFPERAIIFLSQKGKNKQEYRHSGLAGMWEKGRVWRGKKGWLSAVWRSVIQFIPKL